MSKRAIYPGTFDPMTLGHVDIVRRASVLFDEVIVAVADSTSKNTVFTTAERIELAEGSLSAVPNTRVVSFNKLMADCAREHDAYIILRGLRAVSDFEYEFQMANMNRKLIPEADTVFLTPAEQYSYISSSLVREIARLGGDVSAFVTPNVLSALNKRFA